MKARALLSLGSGASLQGTGHLKHKPCVVGDFVKVRAKESVAAILITRERWRVVSGKWLATAPSPVRQPTDTLSHGPTGRRKHSFHPLKRSDEWSVASGGWRPLTRPPAGGHPLPRERENTLFRPQRESGKWRPPHPSRFAGHPLPQGEGKHSLPSYAPVITGLSLAASRSRASRKSYFQKRLNIWEAPHPPAAAGPPSP